MDFAIFNRPGIEQADPFPEYHFIISIRTPGDLYDVKLKTSDKTLGVLRMDFYDINEWDKVREPHVKPELLFNEAMARQMIEFADQMSKDRRLQLGVAHCDHGQSRSTAALAAIQRTVFKEDDSDILKAYPNCNQRVYKTLLTTYESHAFRQKLLLGR